MKTVALASDHAGFAYKEQLKTFIEQSGHQWMDFGAFSTDPVDYPDPAHIAAKAIVDGACDTGVFICGSGIGIGIAANRHRGIRAAMCQVIEAVKLSRLHNDANVLALGERLLTFEQVCAMVTVWLETPFEGGRHQRRVEKIEL
jgi:ribose 5-phosphate isomerase B